MAERPRDIVFETLAQVTSTDWNEGRGELNAALRSIRDQFSEADPLILSMEIEERAKLYRRVFPGAALTPTALAKHWQRVFEEAHRQQEQQATNQSAPWRDCQTCGGEGFVMIQTRPAPQSAWMTAHAISAGDLPIEEYAPCPSCRASLDASFRRYDGTRYVTPDPAKVREMMGR